MPDTKPRPGRLFCTALLMAALVFLPFVIYNKGLFLYYGDFNVQQIPFYLHVHDALLAGRLGWDPITDLGVDLLGSYSFYNITSPFFLLTLAFPSAAVPYLMAPLLVLKTACAALTSYYYLIRFAKEEFFARMGALMYAFSGFMTYNIFFNHFHEAAVFFPLMLIAMEELLQNGRRGFFALATALCAAVNYWFFIGEVVFVVILFFVRTLCDREHCPLTRGRFLHIAFEGALGVGLAAAVFLPAVLTVMGNPRTGADELLTGWGLWHYGHPQRYQAILHSLFFPPELSSLPNFFPDHGAKWASLSAYLPMVGLGGVLVYFRRCKTGWLRRMLLVSALMAAVPAFNALFVLLNNSYYARWYYMPLLLMCTATVQALEEAGEEEWQRPLLVCLGVVAAFALTVGLSPDREDGELTIGLAENSIKMWLSVALALLGLLLTGLLMMRLRRHQRFQRLFCLGLAGFSLLYSIVCMAGAVATFHNNGWITQQALEGRGNVSLPRDDAFARVDFYEGDENMGLFWELPSLQTFHSVVPVSIMEFYPEVGVKRDVSSKPETDEYPLRGLLSVRWLFVSQEADEDEAPMPGYSFVASQYGYDLYENDWWLPMGFAYDRYVTQHQWDLLEKNERDNLLLRGLLLEDEAIRANSDLLEPLEEYQLYETSVEQYYDDIETRRSMATTGAMFEDGGFTCVTDYAEPKMVFFSIPYSEGWSATVDGMPAELLKANVGFMALRVPEGQRMIRLEYRTPGLDAGLAITAGSAAVTAVWMIFGGKLTACFAKKKPDDPTHSQREEADHEGA